MNIGNNPLITGGFHRDYLLDFYQKNNEKLQKIMVYHLGNRGFYAEMTTVARAMLYCYSNGLQLRLCSENFGYSYQLGWQDYFLPFCKEFKAAQDDFDADHCYSDRRGPGTLFKKILGFRSEEITFGPIVVQGMQEILRFFMRLIYRFPPEVEQKVNTLISHLHLPPEYNAIHIRRGDKISCAEDMFYPAELYLQQLINKGVVGLPLFVMSDDFGAVAELENILRDQGVSSPVLTMCNDSHAGFDIFALRKKTLTYSKQDGDVILTDQQYKDHIHEETIRLLAETVVAVRSKMFAGTRKSNIGWVVRALHDSPGRCVLLRPEHNVEKSPLLQEPYKYYLNFTHEYMGEAGHETILKHLAHHVKAQANNKTVLLAEVGMCVGKYLPQIANLTAEENSVILGFEPNPLNYEILRRIKVDRPLRVFPYALSNTSGKQTLSTLVDHPQNMAGYSLASLRGDGDEIATVEVETFDNVLNSLGYDDLVIRYVKIDTEGNDTNVLRGMVQHLPITEYIVFEASDCLDDRRGPGEQTPLHNIVEFLDAQGFDTYKLGQKRLLKINGDHWHEVFENIKFHSNCFALKKDDPVIKAICDADGSIKPLPTRADIREDCQPKGSAGLDRPEKAMVTGEGGSVSDEIIQPMEIAKIAGETICLFFDIFVHWTGNKITATAPYYGNDIDWSQLGIDPGNVVLTCGNISVTGAFIPHGFDTWEPAILFDFESPELAQVISEKKSLEITVSAGHHRQTFTLDCRVTPQFPTAMSLMIRDENRWIKYFIDYYLLCLDVSHIYVYDNHTRDTDQLKKILASYVCGGKVTYVPWHYQRRQRIDTKHIAQTVQESHTLNRYGATPWIGFLDIDEFLRIPGKTLPEFLAKYDPDKVEGLSFDLRWFMYKGELDFEAIGNPLLTFFHCKPDALGRKRQKLMVSARHVRFLRLHWLGEGRQDTPVTDPDVFFHHYYFRHNRFDRGKTEQCTGYDEYMLQFSTVFENANDRQSAIVDQLRNQAKSDAVPCRKPWIKPVLKMQGKNAGECKGQQQTVVYRPATLNHLPIEVVIFSKDRACQLDALLRSMDRFVQIEHRRNVLYSFSNNDFERAYKELAADYPGVNFRKEVNFKQDLLSILRSARQEQRHIMFLVDDILFTRSYRGGENLEAFNNNESILTISLRLGENINYCQVSNTNTVPHDFSKSNMWPWQKAHNGYWNYPMSVDGNIFRADEIVGLIARLDFSNPNTLEGALAGNPISKPFMIAEPEPYLVNLALNRVQDVWANPCGDISQEHLNRHYLNGKRIDFRSISKGKYTSCHITPKVELTERENVVDL